jgi:hypothetical protein
VDWRRYGFAANRLMIYSLRYVWKPAHNRG